MTTLEALKAHVNYPLSDDMFNVICIKRSLDANTLFTKDIAESSSFKGAHADAYAALISATNLSEGGVSISVNNLAMIVTYANTLYESIGEPAIKETISQPKITVEYE